ncbi:MAG TPA: phosphonate ABC transporter ATP-binding protein [Selenomonadales bacterium]|nr:phosphonate ABC transporter ATP-binding protein [Selenomonadales bacterium]
MIQIRGLRKEFGDGTKALRGIDLHVERGQLAVLLGPSGAGKSTLLRCINGLVKATAGEIVVDGTGVHQLRHLEDVRSKVGMIFQQFNLVKRLMVIENVLCGRLARSNIFASCLKLFPPGDIEQALFCLERVGLAEKAYHRADQLSGGQQQRVGIARALAQNPRVILADEPVASLDPRSAERVMTILRDINARDGITVIVSLHNIDLATRYGGRIVGLRDGAVVLDKPGASLTKWDVERIYEAGYSDDDEMDCEQVRYAHA